MTLQRTILPWAIAATCVFAAPALSQTATDVIDANRSVFGADQQQIVSVDYPGGPVLDYIEKLRQAFAPYGKINVVAFPGLEEFTVPPVQLTGVSPLDAMSILDGMMITDERGVATVLMVRDSEMVIVARPQKSDHGQPLETSVWSLEPAIRLGIKSMDILAAVEAALAVFDKSALVKFHQETSLLIARGTGEQLNAINNVLEGVERTASYRREREVGADEIEEAQHEVDRIQIEVQRREARVVATDREVKESESLLNPKDADDAAQLRELINEAASARLDLQEAMIELDAARRRLERLQSATKSAQ